jgi:hypothetical protein
MFLSASRRVLVVQPKQLARMMSGTTNMAVRDAINAAIDEEMARDKNVFMMGEEVA